MQKWNETFYSKRKGGELDPSAVLSHVKDISITTTDIYARPREINRHSCYLFSDAYIKKECGPSVNIAYVHLFNLCIADIRIP